MKRQPEEVILKPKTLEQFRFVATENVSDRRLDRTAWGSESEPISDGLNTHPVPTKQGEQVVCGVLRPHISNTSTSGASVVLRSGGF
jgi:hypothetical protein